MMPLALGLAVIMGLVLGILGGGGSIMTLPILVHAVGMDTKPAIATSLLVVAITSAVGAIQHAREGNVDLRTGLIFSGFAMAGAYAGGRIAAWIPGWMLMTAFILLMLVTGIAMISRRGRPEPKPQPFRLGWVAVEALAVGLFTGMVGAGGGFLVVPALVILGGMAIRQAIGTSLMVIALKSTAGLAGYMQHVAIDFGIAAPITALAVVGALVGQAVSHRLPADSLRSGFAGFVILMAMYMGFEELRGGGLLDFIGSAPAQWAVGVAVAGLAVLGLLRILTKTLPHAGTQDPVQSGARA